MDAETGMMRIQDVVEECHERALLWHPGGLEEWSVADWATAMAGEAGEVCNAVKKLRRIQTGARRASGPENEAEAVKQIGDEIADTFLYLVLLADRIGVDFEQAVRQKFNAVSIREGFPQRL